MIQLSPDQYERLFNIYKNKHWQTTKDDERYEHIYFANVDGTYLTLDVQDEVYIEEFKTTLEMGEFYGKQVHEQATIFDY
ncbi:hypothetical protein [Macrococcus armenti]|uniref:hypothetical protein n=1 Tax=Macrococcus armenti TaxID=2875764 RepID=UPI001CD4C805|nr:hypothetical protein [Macrococcus armenti]UBH10102.1 hypothetical protein LAU38_07390 [Macrococcus armenti]